MKSLQQLTYVSDSKLHGKGLFARKRISKGSVIGKIEGKLCKRDGSHVLWLNQTQGFKVSCNLKYINHADVPNACYYDDLSVVALREIKRNEEITHNYCATEW
jgi:hypothetical protein